EIAGPRLPHLSDNSRTNRSRHWSTCLVSPLRRPRHLSRSSRRREAQASLWAGERPRRGKLPTIKVVPPPRPFPRSCLAGGGSRFPRHSPETRRATHWVQLVGHFLAPKGLRPPAQGWPASGLP